MTDETPKSAYELAMERLRKKDQETGVEERRLTEEQRAAIADIKKVYEARLAEREILHTSKLVRTPEPEAREALETEYRRDRERIASERDRKLEEARREG
jgi:hypothetical protein